MKLYFYIIFLFLIVGKLTAHPVHLSVVNMEYHKEERSIDYSIRFFKDDYNYLIYGIYHDENASATSDTTIKMDKILASGYFNKRFIISIDGVPVKPEFTGIKDYESDVWMFFSIKLSQIPESINIQNKIFLETYRDQINLLILTCGSNENGFTFDYQNTEQLISLKNIY